MEEAKLCCRTPAIYFKWLYQVVVSLGCSLNEGDSLPLTWYIPICRSVCLRLRVTSEKQWQMFMVSLGIPWHFRYALIEFSSKLLTAPMITYLSANTQFRNFHVLWFPRSWKWCFSLQYLTCIPGHGLQLCCATAYLLCCCSQSLVPYSPFSSCL